MKYIAVLIASASLFYFIKHSEYELENDVHSLIEKTLQPMRQVYARDFILEGESPTLLLQIE